MSLEQNINRIATALELIAQRLNNTPVAAPVTIATSAPVATPAPALRRSRYRVLRLSRLPLHRSPRPPGTVHR